MLSHSFLYFFTFRYLNSVFTQVKVTVLFYDIMFTVLIYFFNKFVTDALFFSSSSSFFILDSLQYFSYSRECCCTLSYLQHFYYFYTTDVTQVRATVLFDTYNIFMTTVLYWLYVYSTFWLLCTVLRYFLLFYYMLWCCSVFLNFYWTYPVPVTVWYCFCF